MTRRTRLLSSLLLLAVLLGVPVLLTWRAVRQERLDRALIVAVRKNDTRTVTFLLDHGANPNASYRPVEDVFFGSNASILEKFIWNLHHPLPSRTALLVAVGWQDIPTATMAPPPPENAELVTALLKHGADTEAVDATGNTPLLIATARHLRSVVPVLLAYGAHANVSNKDGETALAFTRKRADKRLQLLLKQAGAKE